MPVDLKRFFCPIGGFEGFHDWQYWLKAWAQLLYTCAWTCIPMYPIYYATHFLWAGSPPSEPIQTEKYHKLHDVLADFARNRLTGLFYLVHISITLLLVTFPIWQITAILKLRNSRLYVMPASDINIEDQWSYYQILAISLLLVPLIGLLRSIKGERSALVETL